MSWNGGQGLESWARILLLSAHCVQAQFAFSGPCFPLVSGGGPLKHGFLGYAVVP